MAEPTAKNPDDAGKPGGPHRDLVQQVFIWIMVIVVGVLFGMGQTISYMFRPSGSVSSVARPEVEDRARTASHLQDILNPHGDANPYGGGPNFQENQDQYAEDIRLAGIAEDEHLAPGGSALNAYIAHWSHTPLPDDPSVTYLQALKEHEGGEKEVTFDALRRYFKVTLAEQCLYARNLEAPAVPASAAAILAETMQTITVDVATLSAKTMLPAVKADDPDIELTYERLRARRFVRPASIQATIAYADLPALVTADTAAVTPQEIAQYYQQHQDRFRIPDAVPVAKPAAPAGKDAKVPPRTGAAATKVPAAASTGAKAAPPAPPAPPRYKPLAAVAATIRTDLGRAKAIAAAKQQVLDFSDAVSSLDDKSTAAFDKAATGAKLHTSVVTIDHPGDDGTLSVPGFGALKQHDADVHLFDDDSRPGFISGALEVASGDDRWLVLHTDARTPAGTLPLSDPVVHAAVLAHVQGDRAYKALVAAAAGIRDAAARLGPGGLRRYLASPAAARFKASIATRTGSPTLTLRPPPEEREAPPAEAVPLISLTMPARPVMVIQATSGAFAETGAGDPELADIPVVQIVQVTDTGKPVPLQDYQRSYLTNAYRRAILSLREVGFWDEVRRHFEGQ